MAKVIYRKKVKALKHFKAVDKAAPSASLSKKGSGKLAAYAKFKRAPRAGAQENAPLTDVARRNKKSGWPTPTMRKVSKKYPGNLSRSGQPKMDVVQPILS